MFSPGTELHVAGLRFTVQPKTTLSPSPEFWGYRRISFPRRPPALCSPGREVTSAAKAGLPFSWTRTGSAFLVVQATPPALFVSPLPPPSPPFAENWARGCPPPEICKLHAHECPLGLLQSEIAAMTSKWRATASWYSHPVYARYWRHYHHAMFWMRSHQNAYRKSRDSHFMSPWFSPHGVLPWNSLAYEARHPWNFQGQHTAWQEPPYRVSHLQSSGLPLCDSSRTQASTGEDEAPHEDEEMESDSDNEVECDLSNMEITEELRQYFAETERHREERRRQQQLDAERLENYVNADHGLYYNHHRSAEPPSEKPGERRQAEMKRLYGDSAPKILAMEAAVQLSFDKYCDKKQPKYWPVIPLKF